MSGPPPPWFQGGLRFECQGCGDCCRGPEPGYVWVTDEEIAALARRLGLGVEGFSRRYVRLVGARVSLVERANHDCIFWDEGCAVYEDRPAQCRTFPFWAELTASPQAWSRIAWCRGKDQGRVYEVAEIEGLARGEGETRRAEPETTARRGRTGSKSTE